MVTEIEYPVRINTCQPLELLNRALFKIRSNIYEIYCNVKKNSVQKAIAFRTLEALANEIRAMKLRGESVVC